MSSADPAAYQAHEGYVAAINSNDLATLLDMLTDDVVFLSAHEPVMVGKAAVRPWLEAYLKAYRTHWDKPVQEFVVNGDWAFERYSHPATRRSPAEIVWPTPGGDWSSTTTTPMEGGGWRDAWGPDHPAK